MVSECMTDSGMGVASDATITIVELEEWSIASIVRARTNQPIANGRVQILIYRLSFIFPTQQWHTDYKNA